MPLVFICSKISKIPFNEEDVILTLYPVLVTTVQVKVIDPLPLAVV